MARLNALDIRDPAMAVVSARLRRLNDRPWR